MKKLDVTVDMPVGDCKTTQNVKSFTTDGKVVYLTQKIEERSFNGIVILEKEKTRVAKSDESISVFQINTIVENGEESKVVEYILLTKEGAATTVKRRKRIINKSKIIEDYKFEKSQLSHEELGDALILCGANRICSI